MIAELIETLEPVAANAERWFPSRAASGVRNLRAGSGARRSIGLVQLRRVRSEHSTNFQPCSWSEATRQRALCRIITF
jgi:hypothetical protein